MKSVSKTAGAMLLHALPVGAMVALIPLVHDDYLLATAYVVVAGVMLSFKQSGLELAVFFMGLLTMTFFEWVFLSTGVEVFTRRSLFGIMPLWLPLLWGYGFVAIQRSLKELSAWE